MKIILPARIEEGDNELRVVDAEDDILCIVGAKDDDEGCTPADYRMAQFFMNAVNTRCPFDGDCEHFDGHSGCDAVDCSRDVGFEA